MASWMLQRKLKNVQTRRLGIFDISEVPKNRRLLRSKWVFELKRDGTYRTCLIAMGFSKVPGVDYTD